MENVFKTKVETMLHLVLSLPDNQLKAELIEASIMICLHFNSIELFLKYLEDNRGSGQCEGHGHSQLSLGYYCSSSGGMSELRLETIQ